MRINLIRFTTTFRTHMMMRYEYVIFTISWIIQTHLRSLTSKWTDIDVREDGRTDVSQIGGHKFGQKWENQEDKHQSSLARHFLCHIVCAFSPIWVDSFLNGNSSFKWIDGRMDGWVNVLWMKRKPLTSALVGKSFCSFLSFFLCRRLYRWR